MTMCGTWGARSSFAIREDVVKLGHMDSYEHTFKRLGGIVPAVGEEFVPMSEDEISALESTLPGQFPASYGAFLKTYGAASFGEYIDFEPIEPLPATISSTGKGHISHFYGAKSSRYKDNMSLERNFRVYRGRMPESLIPIGNDGVGNQICLGVDGDERGKVYFWDHHDEWDEDDYLDSGEPVPPDLKFSNVYQIADSFDDFLQRLTPSDMA